MKWRVRRKLLFLGFRILSSFIILLPMRIGQSLGRFFGLSAYYILAKQREIAFENLRSAFGKEGSFFQRKAVLKLLFKNLGQDLVEVINLERLAKDIDRNVIVFGIEKVDRALKENRGGIIISGHFGNWELLAHYFAIKGYPSNVIARKMRLEDFENLIKRHRERHHLNILYRDEAFREAIELLRHNELLGVMPDQDTDSVEGVFVNFFGRPAYTPIGPALFTILTGAPIIPCFIVHYGRRHKIFVDDPLEFKPTGDRERDILMITQDYTNRIEGFIRRYPSEWIWFHKRWKTQPSQEI